MNFYRSDYLDFLLTVENISFSLVADLLSGKKIGYDLPDDFKELQEAIKIRDLDDSAKKFYTNLVSVIEIYNKYYAK